MDVLNAVLLLSVLGAEPTTFAERLHGSVDVGGSLLEPSLHVGVEGGVRVGLRISKAAFGYRLNFFLTAQPDLSASVGLKVEVNDHEIAPIDPSLGSVVWEYDPVTNSVVFQPLYAPSRGDVLKITYQVQCLP